MGWGMGRTGIGSRALPRTPLGPLQLAHRTLDTTEPGQLRFLLGRRSAIPDHRENIFPQ